MSDKSCRSWIMVRVVSRYRVESATSSPSVPVLLAMRDITLSAETATRTRLSWSVCAASSSSRKSCEAARRSVLVAAELFGIVASWPWFVAESTRPSVAWRLVAALARTSDPCCRFWPTEPSTFACSFVTRAMRFATCPKSLIELRSSSTASESNALWIRLETVAMSLAMRLAWDHSRTSDGEAAHGAEAGGEDGLGFAKRGPGQPERPGDDHRQCGDHHEADGELVLPLHAARPSMN